MLVLERQVGEKIRIGTDVFVEVRKIGESRVYLAIDAPNEVEIMRTELDDNLERLDGKGS